MAYRDPTSLLPLLAGLLEIHSPERTLPAALPSLLRDQEPRRIVTLGKAARSMARGAALSWPGVPGLAYEVPGPGAIPDGWAVLSGSHPLSTAENVLATRRLSDWLRHGEGPLLALVSGGTSSLLADPRPPWTLEEERGLCRELLARGAPIAAVNAVRMRLSGARGGGLRRLCGAGPVFTGIWCDVARRDFRLVGSAPTVGVRELPVAEAVLARFGIRPPHPLPGDNILRRKPAGDRVALLASAETLARTAVAHLRALGFRSRRISLDEGTDAPALADLFRTLCEGAPRGRSAFVAAGEVSVPAGPGRGGRCSHLCALVALELRRLPGWTFAALATDGADGAGGAGAWTRAGETPTEGALRRALAEGDTASLWEAHGTGLERNPTGNNLRDLYVLAVER